MRHLLESDLAAEVKERMDECVARRRGAVAHWHGGMENWKRSHGEGQESKRMGGRKSSLKKKKTCERTMAGEKSVRIYECARCSDR